MAGALTPRLGAVPSPRPQAWWPLGVSRRFCSPGSGPGHVGSGPQHSEAPAELQRPLAARSGPQDCALNHAASELRPKSRCDGHGLANKCKSRASAWGAPAARLPEGPAVSPPPLWAPSGADGPGRIGRPLPACCPQGHRCHRVRRNAPGTRRADALLGPGRSPPRVTLRSGDSGRRRPPRPAGQPDTGPGVKPVPGGPLRGQTAKVTTAPRERVDGDPGPGLPFPRRKAFPPVPAPQPQACLGRGLTNAVLPPAVLSLLCCPSPGRGGPLALTCSRSCGLGRGLPRPGLEFPRP